MVEYFFLKCLQGHMNSTYNNVTLVYKTCNIKKQEIVLVKRKTWKKSYYNIKTFAKAVLTCKMINISGQWPISSGMTDNLITFTSRDVIWKTMETEEDKQNTLSRPVVNFCSGQMHTAYTAVPLAPPVLIPPF